MDYKHQTNSLIEWIIEQLVTIFMVILLLLLLILHFVRPSQRD